MHGAGGVCGEDVNQSEEMNECEERTWGSRSRCSRDKLDGRRGNGWKHGYGVYLGFGQTHNRLVWAPGAQTQLVHCPNWPIGAGMQHLGAIGCPTGGPGLGPSVPTPPPVAKFGKIWWVWHLQPLVAMPH